MKKILPLFCLIVLLSQSCYRLPVQHFSGTAFGTMFSITYLGERSNTLPQQVDSILQELSHTFSIFDTTSLISRINHGEEVVQNQDFAYVFSKAITLSQKTEGAFDCTLQPLIELWGFGRDHQKKIVPQHQIDSVKAFVGYQKINLLNHKIIKEDPRVQLNFNALAKGYAVDRVADFLQSKGYKHCLVEIGGEVVARGSKNGKPWHVGIQVPTQTADGVIESNESFPLTNQAVATSGNYRNFFEAQGVRYTHILNPSTGKPEQSQLLSVTVMAPDCCTADAYATAFMVLGKEKASAIAKKEKLKVWFIYSHNGTFKTEIVNPQ